LEILKTDKKGNFSLCFHDAEKKIAFFLLFPQIGARKNNCSARNPVK